MITPFFLQGNAIRTNHRAREGPPALSGSYQFATVHAVVTEFNESGLKIECAVIAWGSQSQFAVVIPKAKRLVIEWPQMGSRRSAGSQVAFDLVHLPNKSSLLNSYFSASIWENIFGYAITLIWLCKVSIFYFCRSGNQVAASNNSFDSQKFAKFSYRIAGVFIFLPYFSASNVATSARGSQWLLGSLFS